MRAVIRIFTATLAGIMLAGTAGLVVAAASPTAGSRWRVAFVASTNFSAFTGIAALSARDVWAVGINQPPGPFADQTAIIRRWNGRSWKGVSLPATYKRAYLFTVAGSSPSNVWVLGQWRNGKGLDGHLFALRWDGRRWSRIGWWVGYDQVTAAVVLSRTDVWMFASSPWHYNGHGWKMYKLPFGLFQASAISANDVWAVGVDDASFAPVLARWHDGRWVSEPVPSLGSRASFADLVALTDRDIWIVGDTGSSTGPRALSLRRNGGRWTRYKVKFPVPFGTVADDGHGGLWAAFNGFGIAQVAQLSGGAWHLVNLPRVTGKGTAVLELARVPKSRTVYAAGLLSFGGYPSSNALVMRYGP